MARDLGSPNLQVHDEAEDGLRFWFEETPDRLWCKQDDRLDAACAGRFPQRNAALGRETTPEEAAFLSRPGARF